MASQWQLLKTKRFLPLFITQFCGALNDNIFKNALAIYVTYIFAKQHGINASVYVNIIAAAFVLPYFFFSSTAGLICDRFEKSFIIRLIKQVEIVIALLAGIFFYFQSIHGLIFVLFLLGAHSAFFGPVKFSILPDHLQENELVGGNAMVEMGTFSAILLGTILAGLFTTKENGIWIILILMMIAAFVGLMSANKIPKSKIGDKSLSVSLNFWGHTREAWNYLMARRLLRRAVMGISWFWFVGALLLTQLSIFAERVVHGNEQVLTLFLTLFSLGIGVGSLLCHRLVKGQVDPTFVPLACLGMSIFGFDLALAANSIPFHGGELVNLKKFLSHFHSWRLLLDMLFIALCSGIYIVPLYAFIQARSSSQHRSRVLAANNVMNSLFMVGAAAFAGGLGWLGFSTVDTYFGLTILNLIVAAYITKLLPKALIRSLLRSLFDVVFRVKIEGYEHFANLKGKAVIVANHQSYLDGIIFWVYFGDHLSFAINTFIGRNPIIKWFLEIADCFLIDASNPMTVKTMIRHVKLGRKLVIFPEGRITMTGSLMKVYAGPGLIADMAEAPILPICLNGLQYTPFARLTGKMPRRIFPRVTIKVMPPVKLDVPHDMDGRIRRQKINLRLYDIMSEVMYASQDYEKTLFETILGAQRFYGKKKRMLEDIDRKPITYGRILKGSFVLGEWFKTFTKEKEFVGVMLPNVNAVAATFYGLQASNRVPAMINFTTGPATVISCCKTAKIRHVITSRRFIESIKLGDTVGALTQAGVKVHYLDDLAKTLSLRVKLMGVIKSILPQIGYYLNVPKRDPHEPAVVLFTSGSEGVPKGVVLSHKNLNANRCQLLSRIDLNSNDRFFNALPVFHSFGLVAGLLLPMGLGIRTFLYPSPLHYRIIPEMVYDQDATIMFGTNTFLKGYAMKADPYDFYSVRYIFAGAEKLQEDTRQVYAERFGVRVLEGYGATETAPVLTFNTPMHNQPGTVGRFLPGIDHKIEKVKGIKEGGRLHVRGDNVMLGYLLAAQPGVLQAPPDGWYDTGDIVEIDGEGFVKIKGRAKRFAKIGGEMVSLSAVEEIMSMVWPDSVNAVVAQPDSARGEVMLAVTDCPSATLKDFGNFTRKLGYAELFIPKQLVHIKDIPLLGSGKVNYIALADLLALKKEKQ